MIFIGIISGEYVPLTREKRGAVRVWIARYYLGCLGSGGEERGSGDSKEVAEWAGAVEICRG